MKKLLFTIMLFVLGLGLMGCSGEPKQFPEDWVLDYTIDHYNEDYEGYGIIAYTIEPLTIFDREQFEQWADGYSIACYRITVTNNSGKDTSYNVFMAYKKNKINYLGMSTHRIKESQIYDIDIEKGE